MKMSGARRMTIGVFAMAILAISNARLLRIITKIVDDQPSRWDWRDDVKDFAALRPGLPKKRDRRCRLEPSRQSETVCIVSNCSL